MSANKVEFDRPKLERLKKAIKAAEIAGADTFTFEGHDYLVSYARYLVEYLESRLLRER
jgi:hypothetical protein